jgi:predicted alpha-1,2-mannosidase
MNRTRAGRSLGMTILVAVTVGAFSLPAPTTAGEVVGQVGGPATDFFSSFEAGDPQPDWINTVEVDAEGNRRASGVVGSSFTGIPGSIMDRVVAVEASGENQGGGEVAENLIDGDVNTKWLVFEPTGWVRFELSEPIAVVHYALSSANDFPSRDPRDWTVQGSQDGETWTSLDARSDQEFSERFQTKEYRFENAQAYRYYRLDITRNSGAGIVQLAEVQLSNGDTAPPPPSDMRSLVGNGPAGGGFTSKPSAGFTGLRALQYSGSVTSDGGGFSYNRVFDVDIAVMPTSELSYVVFPEFTAADMQYPSTYAAVELAFTDGTYLSDLGATDQHLVGVHPEAQGRSKTIYADQWNLKASRIGEVAAGKTIDRILVGYDSPEGPAAFRGWVDDIKIVGNPSADVPTRPSEYVLTTRGTNSTGGFSRGNNIPATAVPHGFNFWVPVTNAGSLSWLYEYHRDNNAANLPALEAFAVSHEPSPWMGDRQTFQVMPSAAMGTPSASRSARALPFRHENEIAQPHFYGVTFENGIRTEMAPTDHAAIFRFTFNGDSSTLLFDNVTNEGGLTLDPANGVVTGFSDVRSGLSTGATRLFVYATFDRPVAGSGTPSDAGSRANVAGYYRFDTSVNKVVTMRIATSLISVDQAKRNLELEIAPTDTFEAVKGRAQQLWDEKLGIIEVEGATMDQLTTLYSNLYRLFLYPNSAFENTGTAQDPVYKHAVQSSISVPPSTPTQTGAPIADGKVYVNNGFWDTYRTTWPAYSLLTPTQAGEMVDGFVQQYKDGGWIARWSSPGYANLMVGTSSDVAFADAYLKGVRNFDVQAAYDAAVKNATVAPPNQNVGRKGFSTSVFLGYTAVGSTAEAMSWALDGYINDFGIANMALALSEETPKSDPRRRRYLEDSEYFLNRAQNYVHMFDPAVGFFQGRLPDGMWRLPPEEYDPRVWGFDYTETNGWNMAFHVPHDGQGLANLYGGRKRLAQKLDQFFATPETAQFPGSYGGIIHEMREARDVRMGQYGHSNQPSHHIIYMYDYAGQPWKTQALVREALSRLYVGSEIGQGYPGDEDNGELSAWQIFSALGFYPLQMGSPHYVIGSPLFRKATIHLENGRDLVINAPDNSPENVYVQGLEVNGKRYRKTYLPHSLLANGAVLDFDMGPSPSTWGTGGGALPRSITDDDDDDEASEPLQDQTGPGAGVATGSDGTDAARLFDNTSVSRVTFPSQTPWVQYRFARKKKIGFYTLTSVGDTTIPGSIMDRVVTVEANGENPPDEVAENLVDGDAGTKWLVFEPTGWVRFELSEPVAVVDYALTSANDAPTRDPRDWTLQGSNDGENWTTLDTRTDQTFAERFETKEYRFDNDQAYRYYRLDITRNSGSGLLQLAEVQLSDGSSTEAGSPTGWRLLGSKDGRWWNVLDARTDEPFRWPRQTRAFKVVRKGSYTYYRIEVTGNSGQPSTSLAEIELMN